MKEQYDLIHNTDWDTLVIADAMRYDFFKKYNKFKGRLIRARSNAAHTYQWLERTFPDKYPWIYFSAHLWIGDKVHRERQWNGIEHFEKVIPIWETGWNDRLGTVHPDEVGKVVRDYFEEHPPQKCIIHYVQPHGPWIGEPQFKYPHFTKEMHEMYGVMADYIAEVMKPEYSFMKRAYRGNVKLVLKSIGKYLKYFPGQVVISADHGEMLGEGGKYLHKIDFPKWADDLVKTVPWLILRR